MRSPLPLLILSAWTIVPLARAQTAAPRPDSARQAMTQRPAPSAAATTGKPGKPRSATRSRKRHSLARDATDATRGRAEARKGDGVLSLDATDITGNKELPKVMVIVPWKSSAGADGVIKPTDSLLNEVLGPVDRGVFQRRIRYYGQLNAPESRPAAGSEDRSHKPGAPPATVAPVGDRH